MERFNNYLRNSGFVDQGINKNKLEWRKDMEENKIVCLQNFSIFFHQ